MSSKYAITRMNVMNFLYKCIPLVLTYVPHGLSVLDADDRPASSHSLHHFVDVPRYENAKELRTNARSWHSVNEQPLHASSSG